MARCRHESLGQKQKRETSLSHHTKALRKPCLRKGAEPLGPGTGQHNGEAEAIGSKIRLETLRPRYPRPQPAPTQPHLSGQTQTDGHLYGRTIAVPDSLPSWHRAGPLSWEGVAAACSPIPRLPKETQTNPEGSSQPFAAISPPVPETMTNPLSAYLLHQNRG